MRSTLAVLLCGFTVVLAWSAVHPHDYFTWALEIFPAILALAALAITYRRFQFITFVAYFFEEEKPCIHATRQMTRFGSLA